MAPTLLPTPAAFSFFLLWPVLLTCVSAAAPVFPPYTNHTVGGAAGWRFNSATNTSATNYTLWASTRSFFLGDFLIFDTDATTSVIQTYNLTTYRRCNLDQDFGNLTSQYEPDTADGGGGGSAGTVPVPLTVEGDNYYYSNTYGGLQCQKGLRFHLVVQHGRGLPPIVSGEAVPAGSDRSNEVAPAPAPKERQRHTFDETNGVGGVPVRSEWAFWALAVLCFCGL